jgi:hypothetical protein
MTKTPLIFAGFLMEAMEVEVLGVQTIFQSIRRQQVADGLTVIRLASTDLVVHFSLRGTL